MPNITMGDEAERDARASQGEQRMDIPAGKKSSFKDVQFINKHHHLLCTRTKTNYPFMPPDSL